MPYWIHRNGENVGPYDLAQLQKMLAAGQATAGDLAIEEGASEWSTVGELASAAPPPSAEPVMAELVSTGPTEEPAQEAATEKNLTMEAAAAGSSKLKLALIGLVALLVVGGGVFAFSHFTDDSGDSQKLAKGKTNPKPPTPGNTPKPGGNRPDKLPGLPNKFDPNSGTNTLPPLPPPQIDPPVITGGNNLTPQPAPEAVTHIPANAIGVASINLGRLLKKTGGYQALLDKFMQAAGPEVAADPMIKNMAGLFAPDKLAANFGIGINEPLLAFTTGDMKVGVLLPVADANKLELAIPNIAVMLKAEFPEFQPADGYKYVALREQAAAVALGPNAVVVLIDTMPVEQGQPKDLTQELAQLMKLPAAGGGQLAQVNPNFAKHTQMPYDGALWLDVKGYIKAAGENLPPFALESIGNPEVLGEKFEISGGISFEQGRIVTEVLMGYDEKLVGDWSSGANLDAGILDAIPGNTIAVLTQSMNMDVIRPFVETRVPNETIEEMNEQLASLGLSWESLINLPGGDLALTLLDLREEQPEILFSMNLTDPSKANEVLGKVKATPIYGEMQQSGFDVMIKGNVLHIAPLSLKGSLETGQNGTPLNLDAQKLLGENDSAVYFNVASLTKSLPPMDPAAMAMVQQFKGIYVIGNAEPSGQRFTATVTMADPNANVLQVLVDQAFTQVMQLQNGGGLPFPQPPSPSPFPAPPEINTPDAGKGDPPSPFPPPPSFGEKSQSSIKIPQPPLPDLPTPSQPAIGNKTLTPRPPAPLVPEPNPFNPK